MVTHNGSLSIYCAAANFGLFSTLGLSSKIWYKYGEIKRYITFPYWLDGHDISETLSKSEKAENIALGIEILTLFQHPADLFSHNNFTKPFGYREEAGVEL